MKKFRLTVERVNSPLGTVQPQICWLRPDWTPMTAVFSGEKEAVEFLNRCENAVRERHTVIYVPGHYIRKVNNQIMDENHPYLVPDISVGGRWGGDVIIVHRKYTYENFEIVDG